MIEVCQEVQQTWLILPSVIWPLATILKEAWTMPLEAPGCRQEPSRCHAPHVFALETRLLACPHSLPPFLPGALRSLCSLLYSTPSQIV